MTNIFADSLNWDLLTRQTRSAVLIRGQRPAVILPISAWTSSRFLIVKVDSPIARRTWRLGAWVSIKTEFEASFASQINSANTEILKFTCNLKKATLIEIPDFQNPPYFVLLEFPRWLEEVIAEIWYYNP